MELKDLVGIHQLSGVDTAREEIEDHYGDIVESEVVRFVLDNITYKAVEDPSDGYRSRMRKLLISKEAISNMFPPQEVEGVMTPNDEKWDTVNDVLELYDTTTKKLVLAIGTGNTDDYYPYCVLKWNPQNMKCNIHR